MKSLPVKGVNNFSSFDIAEYDYDHQIALLSHNFKEKC